MNRTMIPARTAAAVFLLAGAMACGGKKVTGPVVETVPVERRDIVVTAQATGTVEPVDTVAVKSQASGMITAMPVEIGTQIKPGDLIAQIDTRNLKNDHDRAVAAEEAAQASLTVAQASLERAKRLYAQKVITADEHESAIVQAANAQSTLTSARTTLRNAEQALDWATVRAEVGGTVIGKEASVGTVVQSAVSSVGNGTTIITIANLQRVRVRAFVNETDIGNVRPGMSVDVTIDAFPSRRFRGQVEKIEPKATVEQSVTMFPVLVSLDNVDQALLPGMNGQVSIVTQERRDVLVVPNDAVRSMRDLSLVATGLGIDPESLQAEMRARRPAGDAPAGAPPSGDSAVTGNRGTGQGEAAGTGTGARAGAGNGSSARGSGNGAAGGGTARGTRATPQLVIIKNNSGWTPRLVRLGANDFDYSEVLSGLEEGDEVALLGPVVLQAQRTAQNERMRRMTSGALPGGSSSGGNTTSRTGSGSGAATTPAPPPGGGR